MKQQGLSKIIIRIILASIIFTAMPLIAWAGTAFSQRPDVTTFINEMVTQYHFNRSDLIKLFNRVEIQPKVLESITKPHEAKPWFAYRPIFLTQKRIELGVEFWQRHQHSLALAEKKYGVPAEIIVAVLGVETYYGEKQGNYKVLNALSTLAFDYPPRAKFFRKELQQYLLLAREQHFDAWTIEGSYAGAIGQPQFMPSSYRHFAVDFSQSGRADLIHNPADAIASVANYLQQHGWQAKEPIVTPAKITKNKTGWVNFEAKNPEYHLSTLAKYGYHAHHPADENALAGVIKLALENTPEYWIGFPNFYVITRYNTSKLYAMAVCQLAEKIAAAKQQKNNIAMKKQQGKKAL